MSENNSELIQYFDLAIKKAVPSNLPHYQKAVLSIFSPPFSSDMDDAFSKNNISRFYDLFEKLVTERFFNCIKKDSSIDESQLYFFIQKTQKAVASIFLSDDDVNDEVKYSFIKFDQDKIEEYKFIHGTNNPFLQDFEKYYAKKEELFSHANRGNSFKNIIHGLNNHLYILEINLIISIDTLLRPSFIDKASPELLQYFMVSSWHKNQPLINWLGSQKSLLYLLLKLNDWKKDLPNGRLSHFISLTFTIKGKIVSQSNISKAISKISSSYNSLEIDSIETRLKSIQS